MPCGVAIRWSGCRKAQILGFHWKPEKQRDFARAAIEGQLSGALEHAGRSEKRRGDVRSPACASRLRPGRRLH